jgi:uroporphyrinogen decarboxylase
MTSKERVRKAIGHEQPDRVPIDYYARDEVSRALARRLGVEPGEPLRKRLGVDLREINPVFKGKAYPLGYSDPSVQLRPDGAYQDIWGVGFRPNETAVGFYMDLAYHPLRDITSDRQIEDHPWPTPDLWDYSTIAEQGRANGDYWVWTHSRGVFEISWFLRGFDAFMEDLMLAPERACAVMDHVLSYLIERTRCILEAGRGLIDMIEYNDDVGSQRGLLISPDMWREFVRPRMARLVAMCKSYGVKMRYHSCGGIRPIIPDLIDVGIDVLNPIQTLAAGMEPAALKRDFGDGLTLNGGIDTQELLPHATPDEVRRQTRWLIDILGRDGGFILAPSHVYQPDVPIENIVAVYETARSESGSEFKL